LLHRLDGGHEVARAKIVKEGAESPDRALYATLLTLESAKKVIQPPKFSDVGDIPP
jgi:hypothetical protein